MFWKNLYYKARRAIVKLYFKTRDYCLVGFAHIWVKTPWFKAIVRAALASYADSELYRLRCVELDSAFAFKAFFEYGEINHFRWKAKREGRLDNKWKLVFRPDTICQEEVAGMFVLGL
jgi:hypothetical protein